MCVMLYGDGKLPKQFNTVTTTMPFEFDIDVTGVNMLTIKVKDKYKVNFVNTYSVYRFRFI